MTRAQMDQNLIERICVGNTSAMDWLANYWSPYCHEIDDIVDGDRPDARDLLKTFARAAMLYSHPFYLANWQALRAIVLTVTVSYADSVHWEQSPTAWQRDWADHNRHSGMEMVIAVAAICGGHEHAFNISQEQRVLCHVDHHDRAGVPN